MRLMRCSQSSRSMLTTENAAFVRFSYRPPSLASGWITGTISPTIRSFTGSLKSTTSCRATVRRRFELAVVRYQFRRSWKEMVAADRRPEERNTRPAGRRADAHVTFGIANSRTSKT